MEKEMGRIRELSDRLVYEGLTDAEAHELRACTIRLESMMRKEESNG